MKARCPHCSASIRVIVPARGDGSGVVYVRHVRKEGRDIVRCEGSRRLAEPEAIEEGTTT